VKLAVMESQQKADRQRFAAETKALREKITEQEEYLKRCRSAVHKQANVLTALLAMVPGGRHIDVDGILP
jgi:primosomal protein N''